MIRRSPLPSSILLVLVLAGTAASCIDRLDRDWLAPPSFVDADADVDSDADSDGESPGCGDGECRGTESPASCPRDCPAVCGDRVCDGPVETPCSCHRDCDFCGDRVCSSAEASDISCPEDCLGWVRICPAEFTMGSPLSEESRGIDETPHEVTLTFSFEISTTEVTQGQFEALMGYNPSYFSTEGEGAPCGSDCPVEMLTWSESAAYCNALSDRAELDNCYVCSGSGMSLSCELSSDWSSPYMCPGYRLPMEAEWELTARSGTSGARYGELDAVAWYQDNADGSPHIVGTREPSPWGLYDMLGNVSEWCHDRYQLYHAMPVVDPVGQSSTASWVWRGSSYASEGEDVRAAFRMWSPVLFESTSSSRGFRPVRTIL